MYSIETIGLTHRFTADETAIDSVCLQVQENTIYGFLGPNGAGKTTTLKLVLGLLRKQRGEVLVFGKPFASHRIEALRKIGSMIETPSIYGHLTARENLQVLQKIYQCPTRRIAEVLELVDLTHTGTKKAQQFSLGMKQRLSIAMALLHEPSLLILDEPSNGLDPNGMVEIRELLQRLNKNHGTTVLVSSHLLSEIEKLVTHIGIINHGKLLFQGTLPELLRKQQQNSFVVFETSDDAKAAQLLKELGVVSRHEAGKLATSLLAKETVAAINQKLVNNQIEVYQITTVEHGLEQIFFDVISE